jgi:hypothetical protein
MRYLSLLGVLLLTGCAAAALAPPLVEDIPGSEREYSWRPMKWTSGQRLTYRVDALVESHVGEKANTGGGDSLLILTAQDATARGWTPVDLSTGDKHLGTVVVDRDGRPRDVIKGESDDVTGLPMLLSATQAFAAELEGRPLIVDQPVRFVPNWSRILSGPLGAAVTGSNQSPVECAFLGYKRLTQAPRVAALRCRASIVSVPVPLSSADAAFAVDQVSADATTYTDALHGVPVASFVVITLGGQAGPGQRATLRLTTRQVLDSQK